MLQYLDIPILEEIIIFSCLTFKKKDNEKIKECVETIKSISKISNLFYNILKRDILYCEIVEYFVKIHEKDFTEIFNISKNNWKFTLFLIFEINVNKKFFILQSEDKILWCIWKRLNNIYFTSSSEKVLMLKEKIINQNKNNNLGLLIFDDDYQTNFFERATTGFRYNCLYILNNNLLYIEYICTNCKKKYPIFKISNVSIPENNNNMCGNCV